MSLEKSPEVTGNGDGKARFPSIVSCDLATEKNRQSIAADLDGTLLISRSSFPYFMLVAVEAGSLLRGLILLLSFPLIAIAYIFISESLAIKMLIYISYAGLRVRDIEIVSRAVLPRFYAANVRAESFQVFSSCNRKVVVTANPTIMVDAFVKDYLGGDKVLGTEIEVNQKTKRATGFVKKPGVLVGKWKKIAIQKEFGDDSPDIGIGDRESDHDYMSICKVVQDNQRNREKDLPYFISFGPKTPATTYSTYFINGYVLRVGDYGSNRSTMNSGICVHANDTDYYGLLEEIIELQYPGPCLRVVLFRCIWFDPTRGTRVNPTYRLVEINMKHRYLKYDPFVLAQQAIQVYYSNYPTPTNDPNCEWLAVCKTKARGKIEEIWKNEVEYQQEYPTIELYIPLDIPLYNVNDLSDPNILNVELDGSDEIELCESGSEETEDIISDSDVEPIVEEEQSEDDVF